MDSVTRFAMAQREIGLAAGEPPTTKGYTPTVFTELPKLLERAGPGSGPARRHHRRSPSRPCSPCWWTAATMTNPSRTPCAASWTATSSWTARSPSAAAFPAIDVLKSVSRTLPGCQTPPERELNKRARQCLSAYANMEELIKIGAYRTGADPIVDRAIALNPALEAFLGQDKDDAHRSFRFLYPAGSNPEHGHGAGVRRASEQDVSRDVDASARALTSCSLARLTSAPASMPTLKKTQ